MTFGEKIYKLRKENGLSQEDLADKLKVSRQSISKWETDCGYPETEKIIKLAKIFNVTIDYLLVEDNVSTLESEKVKDGLYVNKEKIEEFLLYENRKTLKISLAFGIFVSSLAFPFLDISNFNDLGILIFMFLLIISICLLISIKFIDNPYKELYSQKLFIDKTVKNEFISSYNKNMKKNHFLAMLGTFLICLGFLFMPLLSFENLKLEYIFLEIGLVISGIGTFLIIYFFRSKKIMNYIIKSEEC